MTIRPLGNRIFASRVEKATETAGGIMLPDTLKEKPMEAVVVAVGPGEWKNGERNPVPVNPGDRIVFGKWAGDDVEVNGVEYVVLEPENIIGVLK